MFTTRPFIDAGQAIAMNPGLEFKRQIQVRSFQCLLVKTFTVKRAQATLPD